MYCLGAFKEIFKEKKIAELRTKAYIRKIDHLERKQ